MKIGVDIDGVLMDLESWQFDYCSKYYLEGYDKKILNPHAYKSRDIFNSPKEVDDEIWSDFIEDYMKQPPRRFAAEVISKLREEGNEIYIITSRLSDLSYMGDITENEIKKYTEEWLKINNISYDKLIFSPENKFKTCMENEIIIMVEDNPENIYQISQMTPVICYHAMYNEQCIGDNIHTCYSWYDVYRTINSKIKCN